jgi:Nitrile hydratase, alpha chain
MTEQQRFQDKQWGQIVAKAWADEDFKRRLMAEPAAVLREHGLEIAPGVEVSVHEESDTVRHLVLPPNPAGDLLEEELTPTAGADSFSNFCGDCHRCYRCGRCGCGCDRA